MSLLDHYLRDGNSLCHVAEIYAERFPFLPRFFFTIGLDQQAHLLAVISDAHVVPRRFEPAVSRVRAPSGLNGLNGRAVFASGLHRFSREAGAGTIWQPKEVQDQ